MKALVTGAAGFIGSHLVEDLLADGHEVTGVDAFVSYYPRAIKEQNLKRVRDHRAFRLIEGRIQDLRLQDLLEGVSEVYHLAAQAGVRASWGGDFDLYVDHNVLATQRLLEAAIASGRPLIVFASSSSVYGDAAPLPLREDAACRPLSPYGVTKLACEHLIRVYMHNHGVSVVSLRYFTVYGPRQRPDMAFHRFLKACRDGETIHVYGDGEQTRDFTYVDDIISATRAAACARAASGIYNIGGGERVSVNEVLRRIEATTGKRLTVIRKPVQKGDMRDTFADTTRAVHDLGFRSTVNLDRGLALEWDWILESR